MKRIFAVIVWIIPVLSVCAQVEYNEYGEVKTSITDHSAVQGWQQKDIEESKDSIVKWLGEGMYYDILNHNRMDQWPDALNPVQDFWANETQLKNYNVWFVCAIKGGYDVILRVRAKDNTHMPAGFLPADRSDFYILAFHFGVKDAAVCHKALKNNPGKYPEALYARNLDTESTETAIIPGEEEFYKGRDAEKIREFAEALEWYKKSAEKGNRVAMYNIGILYYNDNTGKEYSTDDIIFDALNPGVSLQKRYEEALKWFKASADAGLSEAMYDVGTMYRDGKGTDKDPVEAKKWFQKAADLGNENALDALKK